MKDFLKLLGLLIQGTFLLIRQRQLFSPTFALDCSQCLAEHVQRNPYRIRKSLNSFRKEFTESLSSLDIYGEFGNLNPKITRTKLNEQINNKKIKLCLKLLQLVGPEFDQFEHPLQLEDSTPKRRSTNTKEFKL